jgi:hypothetical protein
MKQSNNFAVITIACVLALSAGCTSVKPWEKQILAQSHMAIEPDPLDRVLVEQIVTSKEGSSGGFSVAGGGCGCN